MRRENSDSCPVNWALLVGIALLALTLAGCGRASNPEATIKRAYNWYVETVKGAQDPWQRTRTDLHPLVTERFLSGIENLRPEIDGSEILDRETSDTRLTVEDVNINGTSATAHVIFTGRMVGRQRLNIYLVQDHGDWKIDDVKPIEAQ